MGQPWTGLTLSMEWPTALPAPTTCRWDGLAIAEERNNSNKVTKRHYGQGVKVGNASYYYLRDHLGSIREMTNSAGAIKARYDYDLWGNRTKLAGTLDSDFGFTGHYYH